MLAAADNTIKMDVYHPNYVYYEITTTTADQNIKSVNAGYYNRKAIVDGVQVPASQLTYVDQVGGVKIPTPGYHEVYFFGENGNFLYTAVFTAGKFTRFPRGTTNINYGMVDTTTIALLETTPPTFNGAAKDFVAVYVPIEALSAYKNATGWSRHTSKLIGVKYNIIED